MLFENEIIPAGPPGSNSLPTMINVDKSYRVGFEADAAYYFSGSFSYNGNLTISDSRFGELNKRQLFSPSVILNQGVNYSIGNYSFNLNHSYFSKSYIDISNENTVDGYFVLNTNLTYTKGMYKLSVQVNNLTGQKYYCNGYVVNGVRYLFPNALTNVYATLIVKL
jgi:iron complex outermembrane receptor protein